MKHLKFAPFIIVLAIAACSNGNKDKASAPVTDTGKKPVASAIATPKNDTVEIRELIKKMLNWAETKKSMELVPALTDSKDSLCIGFDLKKLDTNLTELKNTNFFSAGFIENYKQIILTLDKKAKNKEFKWSTDELPPFNFANDVDPWCDCQDVPYDKPSPWGLVLIRVVSLDKEKGELYWTWGEPRAGRTPDWKDFSYKFKVQKEEGRWKISYLQGFDFKEGTHTI